MGQPSIAQRLAKQKTRPWGAIAIVILTGALLLTGGALAIAAWSTEEVQTCTVTDKDRRQEGSGDTAPRVYTSECGTFEVSDVPFVNWSAADVYGAIEPGSTYEFTTRGWRIPFMSMFPSIVNAEKVSNE